jgi:hypothetical protein
LADQAGKAFAAASTACTASCWRGRRRACGHRAVQRVAALEGGASGAPQRAPPISIWMSFIVFSCGAAAHA